MTVDYQKLIEEASSGCRVSLERLLLASYPRLLRHVTPRIPKLLNGIVGPDDVVQQAFTQAFLKIETFQGRSEVSFIKWLKVISERQIQDIAKSRLRKKRGGERRQVNSPATDSALQLLDILEGDQSTASRQLSRAEAVQALHVCIAELSQDYRDVIQLRYFEGRPISEVAEMAGKSEGAVRGLLDRARAKLRDAMGRASQWLGS